MSTDENNPTEDWRSVTISMVESATNTETHDVSVATVLEQIRDGAWKEQIGTIRDEYGKAYKAAKANGDPKPVKAAKEAITPLKKNLPALTPSARCSVRSNAGVLSHSGLVCADIDASVNLAADRDGLRNDPYVAAFFASPTATGFKALVRVPADVALHERSYLAARRHFKQVHSIDIDKCPEPSRLCFVSYDPEIFVRNGSTEILEPLEPEAVLAMQASGGYESLPRPCYRLYPTFWHDGTKRRRSGVWFHNRQITKKGENVDTDQWICAPLEILARTTVRGDLEHGRLIEFTSTSGHKKRHILPMRLFAGRGDEALGELLSLGLETSRKLQSHVLEYIQGLSPQDYYAAALSTGWHGEDVFVLPDEIIALENHPEKVWYQGRDQESHYGRAGTLKEWQDNIGALASENPYLIGAICAGFAGPLLYKFSVHGVMVHYLGPSTIGKTTCLYGAASVWGMGGSDKSGFVQTWQSTAVGIEAFASLHSDTLGILDELHLVEPKVLDQASYAIANGCGKSRGNVHASMRPTKHWRVFGLSSGEVSCDTWLRSGGITVRSGQVVRMLDVPVQGTHGAFENLHGLPSGKAFSEELNRNTLRYYGHAGPAFVRKLIEENPALDELLSKATPHFSPSEGGPALNAIQSRAARTFAIMAVAGELAARFKIVPWQEGEAITSCVSLFRCWLGQMKVNNSESPDAKILKLIASYIIRFADSRFSNINGSNDDVRVNDRSGYWKDEAISEKEDRRIFLFTPDALAEAARGYDIHHISAALKAAGALSQIDGDAKHLAVVTRTPHKALERFYYVDPEKLETA